MNDYYCVLPFYSIENEFNSEYKNIFCCRLSPNTDINDVRQSIVNKQRSPNCSTCWNLEDKGLTSERQLHNKTLDFLLDLSIENIESSSISTGFVPRIIKIATSNLCNGQCVTCNSQLSSAWASLEGKSSQYKNLDINELTSRINWKEIVSLSFVGGEPLLEKKNFNILEKLISEGNTKCFISIVTNGSISLTTHQINLLKKFNKLNICLSIDGVGPSFEYMRYPCKWEVLLTNLKTFKSITNNISVSCMISNLNVYYYSEIVDFFKENNLNYLCKQITSPKIFSPGNLPPEFKKYVLDNNEKYISEVKAFLEVGNYSELLFENLKLEISRQNSLKKINLSDYMPEISYLL